MLQTVDLHRIKRTTITDYKENEVETNWNKWQDETRKRSRILNGRTTVVLDAAVWLYNFEYLGQQRRRVEWGSLLVVVRNPATTTCG